MLDNQTFASFSKKYKRVLEEEMMQSIEKLATPTILKEAMGYSLHAGGKRIRPMLLFATLAAFRKDPQIGLQPAIALEMIHTYSLIHDDLPSMDDDDLRRGKPTNHKVFGEAIAILAGDALLTFSFQLISEMSTKLAPAEKKLEIITLLSKAAGAEGMVGGQTADIEGEQQTLTIDQLKYIHLNKTGKLLQFGVLAGAILANASTEQLEQLRQFAYHIGIAFQIRDDILDVEGNEQSLGKRVGSDFDNHKSTYPSLLTMSGAKQSLKQHINEAQQILQALDLNTDLLVEITNMIAIRTN